MKRQNSITGICTAVLLGVLLLTGCSKSEYEDHNGGAGNPNTIYMKNSTFSNPDLLIAVTGKVTWVNDDNMMHTVTALDGSFNSGDIPPGGSFSWTFNTAGTVNYHCIYHVNMTGKVTAVIR